MKSLSNIITELDSVISSIGINSTEVQALKLLLANSIYINESEANSLVLESTPITCLHLNSAIMHAASKGYSVFRGKNPRCLVYGLTPKRSLEVHKYDTFLDIQGYKLVYGDDYLFTPSVSITESNPIKLILTKKVESGSFNAIGSYSITIGNNVSEDLYLYTIDSENLRINWELNKIINAYSDTNNSIYQVTVADYAVKLLSINAFIDGVTFLYRYLPLLDSDATSIDVIIGAINKIPDFNLIGNSIKTDIKSNPTIFYEPWNPKASNLDKIYLDSLHFIQTNNVIKSTSDLQYIVDSLSNQIFAGTKVRFNTSDVPFVVTIYYNLKPDLNEYTVTDERLNDLADKIRDSYYTEGIEIDHTSFIKSTPIDDIAKWNPSELTIKYKSEKDLGTDIRKKLRDMELTYLGGEFNPSEIPYKLQLELNELSFIGFEYTPTSTLASFNLTVDGTDHYPKLHTIQLERLK